MCDPKLVLDDVNIYYGDFHAVQNVNLTIPAQAVTAFIGPSGCGKSTVLRTLNRMHEVIPGARVAGKILLDGQDIYAHNVDPVAVRVSEGEPVSDDVDRRKRGCWFEAGWGER